MANEQRKVWLQDKEEAWVKASVVEEAMGQTPRIITVERDDGGEQVQVEVDAQTGEGETVKARNLFEEDSDVRGYEAVHDLTSLTHLHEAEILEALSVRFQHDQIYTYTGPILLAVNPFKELKIYSEDILGTYYSSGLLRAQQMDAPRLRPHVFAIADAAYRNLMESSSSGPRMDQSILVSGESGAGKTETTKYVMRYLATVAKAEDSDPNEKGRAERVLESNPILESFGNARTNRNDNSSRFGKFIQMSFDSKGFLVGAQIATYLLEKVRLTKQGKGERNFHVFYQMCSGASDEDRQKWLLPSLEDSSYTNQSDVYDRRDGVMDADQFVRTDEAFVKMKFSGDERDAIYSVASAVMNMGNIRFNQVIVNSNDGSEIAGGLESEPLKNVAALLQVNPELLVTALTVKTITTGKETFKKALDLEEAQVVRDALGKTIYSRMFDWLVKRVNVAISTEGGHKSSANSKNSFIGVLDIFGFEVFEHNSFEQLCINYANETLQQQFNEFVFQLEQKLYQSEKIKWEFIDFPDNKPVLDMIEAKAPKPGILALLDEQCLFPQGNDKALANKLYDMLGGGANAAKVSPAKAPPGASPSATSTKSHTGAGAAETNDSLLFASPADRRDSKFCVRHYAGVVTYSAMGFCAKNKDELRDEVLALMRTSAKQLVLQLFPETAAAAAAKAGSVQSETVGSQFKGQLASLLKTIKATSPHYVRCLKPNDQNVRETLVRPRVVDQLRYGGVLEAVKVARAGYPTRFSLRDFVRRYFMLSANMKVAFSKRAQTFAADDERWLESCEMICNGPEKLEKGTQFQIGRTKVFMRKSAFEKLETARSKVFKTHSTQVQKIMRGYLKRRAYVRYQASLRLIQRMIRGFIGRRRARAIRRNNAAVKVQAIVRQFVARSKFMRMKEAATCIERVYRGHQGRTAAKAYRIFVMARTLQSFVRRSRARKVFLAKQKASVVIQTAWRGLAARKELKDLRMQQREAGFLREKINELQRKITQLEEELRIERSSKGAAIPTVAVAAEVLKEKPHEAPSKAADEDHVPPARSEEEEPKKKRAPATAEADENAVNNEELQQLRQQVQTQAEEIARLKASSTAATVPEPVSSAVVITEEEMDLKIAEIARINAEKQASESEVAGLKSQLEGQVQEIARIAAERDSLAQGADPQALVAKAFAERDEMSHELQKVVAQLEAVQTERKRLETVSAELEALAKENMHLSASLRVAEASAAAAAVAAQHEQQQGGMSTSSEDENSYIRSLKEQLDALAKSHAQEIARLKDEKQQLQIQQSSNVPSSGMDAVEVQEKLSVAMKEVEKLKSALVRATEETARVAEERDSYISLVSSSPDEMESTLKTITEEKNRLAAELQKEKENAERLAAERDSIASLAKASSEDDRLTAIKEREALFEKERTKLLADVEILQMERDALAVKLSASPKTPVSVPAEAAAAVMAGTEAGDLDTQLAKTTTRELELAKDVLTKENDDLKEERLKLLNRVEELEVMHKQMQEANLRQAAQKRSFFSRGPSSVMMPSTNASPVSDASVTSSALGTHSGDGQKALPTRSEILAARCTELEAINAELNKKKDELINKIMDLTNESNGKDMEIRKLKIKAMDLSEKNDAMSELAAQHTDIKIKLARRLDTLLQENKTLKESNRELEDQVAAMRDVSRVLNDELKRTSIVPEQDRADSEKEVEV